jgi:hypothetical protein
MTKRFEEEWNGMSLEEKNVIVSSYLKTLPKWDLKRIMCDVLQVDSYMDDEQLSRKLNELVWTR